MLAKRFGLARLADVVLINYIVVCTMKVCSQTCFAGKDCSNDKEKYGGQALAYVWSGNKI